MYRYITLLPRPATTMDTSSSNQVNLSGESTGGNPRYIILRRTSNSNNPLLLHSVTTLSLKVLLHIYTYKCEPLEASLHPHYTTTCRLLRYIYIQVPPISLSVEALRSSLLYIPQQQTRQVTTGGPTVGRFVVLVVLQAIYTQPRISGEKDIETEEVGPIKVRYRAQLKMARWVNRRHYYCPRTAGRHWGVSPHTRARALL